MSNPIAITCFRTFGHAKNQYSTAWATTAFFACSAALFLYRLIVPGVSGLPPLSLWTLSVAQILPVFAAFVSMGVWSDEVQTGRVEALLSIPVMERDLVLGKFFGVWLFTMIATCALLCSMLISMSLLCPEAFVVMRIGEVAASLLALALQSMLWCAVSVAVSAMFWHSAVAFCVSLVLLVALPRGLWAAFRFWTLGAGSVLSEFFFDSNVLDLTGGEIQVGVVIAYFLVSGVMLFWASKSVAWVRLVGKGAGVLRCSTIVVMMLSLIFVVLAARMALRLPIVLNVPLSDFSFEFSPRTRNILWESGGNITCTAFLSRSDPRFRKVSQLLRALKREVVSHGGSNVEIMFVDPHWDIGASERLVHAGISDASLVFRRGRRTSVLPLSEGFDERAVATAVRRLIIPLQRRNVYWTAGHGEVRFDDYGAFGMSDIARDLVRVGYSNQSIELDSDHSIPNDCAFVLIAGARNDFSRFELDKIDAYLKEGGRVLLLLSTRPGPGLAQLMSNWGVLTTDPNLGSVPTQSGDDVIVSEFSEHPISAQLNGVRVIFQRPLAFAPSCVVDASLGADRLSFAPLATACGNAFAVVSERGLKLGADLAMRPTRLVAIGDSSFVTNAQILERANANRDFMMNAISYLSGVDAIDASDVRVPAPNVVFDRTSRMWWLLLDVVVFPMGVLLFMSAIIFRRRRRT